MDIFSRIDNQAQTNSKPYTEKANPQQEFYLGIDGYKVSEVQFHNDYRNNPEKYGYMWGLHINKTSTLKTKANTKKLCKLLSTPYKQFFSYAKYMKAVQRREKKVEKLLKKGVNPTQVTTKELSYVVHDMSYKERYMLTTQGFDIWGAIKSSYKYEELITENIYFCVKNMNDVSILSSIDSVSLECVINTRKQLDISKPTVDELMQKAISTKETRYFENLNVLFKYGQIALEKEQVGVLCNYLFTQDTFMQRKAPDLTKLCEQVQQTQPRVTKDVYAKYATQKNIKSSAKDKTPKTQVQEQIDKLFEDAQKSAS